MFNLINIICRKKKDRQLDYIACLFDLPDNPDINEEMKRHNRAKFGFQPN